MAITIYRAALVTLDKLVHCPDNNSKQTSLTTACGELDVTSWHVLYDIIIRKRLASLIARGMHVKCDKPPNSSPFDINVVIIKNIIEIF